MLVSSISRPPVSALPGQYETIRMSAREALELGVASEMLPGEKLAPWLWELADHLAGKPILTLRYCTVVLNLWLKRLLQDMGG